MAKLSCTKEELEEARKIDLFTYLSNYEPSELVMLTKDTYSTKRHDSVIINNGLWYRFSRGYGAKSAIDYLEKVEGYSLPQAVKMVLNKLSISPPSITKDYSKSSDKKEILIPKKASNNIKIVDYLMNRGIDEDIINYCIINNLIYQEYETNNVCFVGYDENHNIKYCGLRATNDTRIMHDAKGSSKEYSFRLLSKNNSKSVHIFESSIDLLSYATLMKIRHYDWTNQNFIALSGVYQTKVNVEESKLPIAIENYLKSHNEIEEIILHFDNDIAGRNATQAFTILLKDKYKIRNMPAPFGKDINDYLCYKLGLKSFENDVKNSVLNSQNLNQKVTENNANLLRN